MAQRLKRVWFVGLVFFGVPAGYEAWLEARQHRQVCTALGLTLSLCVVAMSCMDNAAGGCSALVFSRKTRLEFKVGAELSPVLPKYLVVVSHDENSLSAWEIASEHHTDDSQ